MDDPLVAIAALTVAVTCFWCFLAPGTIGRRRPSRGGWAEQAGNPDPFERPGEHRSNDGPVAHDGGAGSD